MYYENYFSLGQWSLSRDPGAILSCLIRYLVFDVACYPSLGAVYFDRVGIQSLKHSKVLIIRPSSYPYTCSLLGYG